MKIKIFCWFCVIFVTTVQPVHSSWFSEITGVDVDLNRGTVSVKAPNLGAIPEMIENLPKDVAQFCLNPAGSGLATAIRFSRGQALNRGTQQIPSNIRQELLPYLPPQLLDRARWTLVDGGITLDSILENWLNREDAVTLDEVIVFRNQQVANDIGLWAHELTHVLQYSQLGVETFAFHYTYNWGQFESQAENNSSRIISSINRTRQGESRNWGYEGNLIVANDSQMWTSVNKAARIAIPPTQCIWIDNATNTTGNNCPVPIRVTGVIVRRLYDGYTFTMPCNEPTCIFGPNSVGTLISPPGHLIIGVTAAYQL